MSGLNRTPGKRVQVE